MLLSDKLHLNGTDQKGYVDVAPPNTTGYFDVSTGDFDVFRTLNVELKRK